MRSTHCLPSYSFGGHEVFDAIPKFTKLYGKSVAIIGGETALSKALPHIRPVLDKAGIKVLDSRQTMTQKRGNGKSSTPILMTRRKYRVAV